MMDPDKIDFSRLGFDSYQEQDLRIILSLTTPELMQEWALAVGPDDAYYGLSLVECAALAMLDADVEAMTSYPEAMAVIRSVQGA
jgi:hypothetical protein